MKLALAQVGKRIDVSAFHLTGYSLGAAQAAFVAKLDETERAFNFQKVLMINPPVSLHSSVARLDRMLDENIPGGLDNFNAFFNEIMAAFSDVYQSGDFVEFNDELFYAAYERYRPDARRLQALIGFAFRIASANMVFTSDVVTHSGFVVPAGLSLTSHDSVTDYFKVSARNDLSRLLRRYAFPVFSTETTRANAGATLGELESEEHRRLLAQQHQDRVGAQ